MDRRQLLFGMTALGLATNLDLNHPLIAQVGAATMGKGRLSDREQAGLRGPVKTCSHFMGDEAESMCDEEYSEDGRLLVWRGCISAGSRVERVFSYDEMGKLIGIRCDSADETDEICYDKHGNKTWIRRFPPRPERQSRAMGVSIMFEATEEGECLIGGGSVTTRYNEDDQPIESLVHDAGGELLTRIVHSFANGHLISETLVRVAFEIPEKFREQLSEEQRRAARAQMKQVLGKHDVFKPVERSYVYDDDGRVIRRLMRMGNFHESVTMTYNEHGDEAGMVTVQSGSLSPQHPFDDQRFEVHYSYRYDSPGNWIEKTEDQSSSMTHRQLTYY